MHQIWIAKTSKILYEPPNEWCKTYRYSYFKFLKEKVTKNFENLSQKRNLANLNFILLEFKMNMQIRGRFRALLPCKKLLCLYTRALNHVQGAKKLHQKFTCVWRDRHRYLYKFESVPPYYYTYNTNNGYYLEVYLFRTLPNEQDVQDWRAQRAAFS